VATHKRTRPRKKHTTRTTRTTHPSSKNSQFLRFPEVKGKVVDRVEIGPTVEAITIIFEDKTVLSFDIESTLTVFPEFSDWKTGNARTLKRWPALHSGLQTVKWM
jgi:hypothetical protein